MQMLRLLARDQGMHAFVLPGDEPGQSIGCFKHFSTRAPDLPPLVLLGKDRNMETLDVTNDAESPSKFQAFFLDVADKGVVVSTAGFDTLELLGPEPPFDFDPKKVPTVGRRWRSRGRATPSRRPAACCPVVTQPCCSLTARWACEP